MILFCENPSWCEVKRCVVWHKVYTTRGPHEFEEIPRNSKENPGVRKSFDPALESALDLWKREHTLSSFRVMGRGGRASY